MSETRPTFIDGLREQCAGLSPADLHSAELLREYVCKGLSAAEGAGAIAARVEMGGVVVEAQFYAVDDDGEPV